MPRAERRTKKRNDQKRMEAEQLAFGDPVLDGSIRAGQPPWVLACGSRATSNSRIGPSFTSWCLIRSSKAYPVECRNM